MAKYGVDLLVIMLLCSYLLLPSNGIPISRLIRNLQDASEETMTVKTINMKWRVGEDEKMENVINRRMDMESNDYSPPSSNPIHTPTPP